ncbi:MAG: M28 family peptidase [Gemmatimonadetes bacterium]|nr:M28 family peptidase [Gemmatimonadota bacterium]
MLASLLRAFCWTALAAAPLSASCSGAGGEAGAEARIERPDFPGEEAHRLVARQVAFGPRIPGTPGHQRQLDWMRAWLAERADTLEVQSFTSLTTYGESLNLTNLLARFHPGRPDRILLVAHWDTRPRADQSATPEEREQPVLGANDGASGTAVLLQLAELLARNPPPIGVDLLFVDGEDYGPSTADMFLGARYFAENKPADYKPLYGVLIDMIGDQQPRFPIEGYSSQAAPEVVHRVWSVAAELGYGDVFVQENAGSISDDHMPLNEGGIRTIDIIDFEYGPGNRFWHTPQDVLENTSPDGLEMVGEVLTELIFRGG